jgi:hypothetical protein
MQGRRLCQEENGKMFLINCGFVIGLSHFTTSPSRLRGTPLLCKEGKKDLHATCFLSPLPRGMPRLVGAGGSIPSVFLDRAGDQPGRSEGVSSQLRFSGAEINSGCSAHFFHPNNSGCFAYFFERSKGASTTPLSVGMAGSRSNRLES